MKFVKTLFEMVIVAVLPGATTTPGRVQSRKAMLSAVKLVEDAVRTTRLMFAAPHRKTDEGAFGSRLLLAPISSRLNDTVSVCEMMISDAGNTTDTSVWFLAVALSRAVRSSASFVATYLLSPAAILLPVMIAARTRSFRAVIARGYVQRHTLLTFLQCLHLLHAARRVIGSICCAVDKRFLLRRVLEPTAVLDYTLYP